MQKTVDMKDLEFTGRCLSPDYEIDGVDYGELENEVASDPTAIEIAQMGVRACGAVLMITDEERKEYKLPNDTKALLCWNDRDPHDCRSGLNALTQEETDAVINSSEQAAIDRILDHYRKNPADDGHPAHWFYQMGAEISYVRPV